MRAADGGIIVNGVKVDARMLADSVLKGAEGFTAREGVRRDACKEAMCHELAYREWAAGKGFKLWRCIESSIDDYLLLLLKMEQRDVFSD